MTPELAGETAGLAQLRGLLRENVLARIAETLKFNAVEFDDGYAVFEGVPGEHAYNPIGTVHGGYAATLLDSALGCAVHTKLGQGQAYTTLELKVSYLKAITTATGTVRAEGRVISFGRRVAFAEATLKDADGRVYATATSTLLVITP